MCLGRRAYRLGVTISRRGCPGDGQVNIVDVAFRQQLHQDIGNDFEGQEAAVLVGVVPIVVDLGKKHG